MKRILKIVFLVLAMFSLTSVSLKAQDWNIYFDFNSDVFRINDVGKLDNVLRTFNPDKHSLYLIGHTDTVGNSEYNMSLSKRRTTAVKEYLFKNGIQPEFIATESKGKLLPVASEQFYNRRVEIFLLAKQELTGSFDEFRRSIRPMLQKFSVPVDVDVEFEANRGTIVTIPANSFVTKDGIGITGDIDIELTEFYNPKDFMSERLSTVSDGILLTSAGAVEINVLQEGQELKIRDGSDIVLSFPKTNETPYYTFYGERQEDGNINWRPDSRQLSGSRAVRQNDLGVTFGPDGTSLIVTDRAIADKVNSSTRFNPVTKKFGVPSEKDRRAIQKYYDEQKKIDEAREKYYNIIRSNQLGFINCDDYIRYPLPVAMEYVVRIKNPDVHLVSAALIFRNTNSFLEFSISDRSSARLTASLPLNEATELIVTGVKDGVPYFSHEKVKLERYKRDELELEPTTYDKIVRRL